VQVAGKKEDLVRRLLEYQRRVRKAAQGSNAAVGIAAAAGSRARV
jgi:ribosomal protein S30